MDVIHTMAWFERCRTLYQGVAFHVPTLIGGVAALFITALIASGVRLFTVAVGRKLSIRRSLCELVGVTLSGAMWLLGVLAALVVAFPAFTPARAMVTVGVLIVLASLLIRDAVMNYMARLYLLAKEPFKIGDTLYLDTVEGLIEKVTPLHTLVRQWDGLLAAVPNSIFWRHPFIIQEKGATVCVQSRYAVEHKEDVDTMRSMIRDIVVEEESVSSDIGVKVIAREMMKGSTDFELTWWTNDDPDDSADSVLEKVSSSLSKRVKPKRRISAKKEVVKKEPTKKTPEKKKKAVLVK